VKYDFVQVDLFDRPLFGIKHLFHFRGWRVDLHVFIHADLPDCFHTHPANAIRIILWGGYQEEYWDWQRREGEVVLRYMPRLFKWWKPGIIGRVRPDFCHRISSLRNGKKSVSLWLRAPRTQEIRLEGSGWYRYEKERRKAEGTWN